MQQWPEYRTSTSSVGSHKYQQQEVQLASLSSKEQYWYSDIWSDRPSTNMFINTTSEESFAPGLLKYDPEMIGVDSVKTAIDVERKYNKI